MTAESLLEELADPSCYPRAADAVEVVQTHLSVVCLTGDRVYKTVIGRNVKLGEAPSFGKPIILYDIMSAGAQSYISLAGEVLAAEEEGVLAHG